MKSCIYKNVSIFLVHALFNSFKNESANDVISGIIGGPNIDKRVINPPNGTIFDN